MARADLIGLMICPECGLDGAEVRPDKSGAPYRFCPDCTAQYFTRGNPVKVKNLMSKIKIIPVAPVVVIDPKPAANDDKKPNGFGSGPSPLPPTPMPSPKPGFTLGKL